MPFTLLVWKKEQKVVTTDDDSEPFVHGFKPSLHYTGWNSIKTKLLHILSKKIKQKNQTRFFKDYFCKLLQSSFPSFSFSLSFSFSFVSSLLTILTQGCLSLVFHWSCLIKTSQSFNQYSSRHKFVKLFVIPFTELESSWLIHWIKNLRFKSGNSFQ